jgi:uncharacterized protein (TIGR02452 family)
MPNVRLLPCVDSPELATARQLELDIPRGHAAVLGQTAVAAARAGRYDLGDGRVIDWTDAVQAALVARHSLPPDAPLPAVRATTFPETCVSVTNETTLGAARRLAAKGLRPLALNFANGVTPGGGFLNGARAQEEVLCRSSALYLTLEGDAMYAAHRRRADRESSDWAIVSPDVPVFRADDGTPVAPPWLLSVVTCAAPHAPTVGQPRAGDLLRQRIERVLAIAAGHGFDTLVLGAWGCGVFANDPARTTRDFRAALEGDFAGRFREVVFAITDWSPERRFLGPFREVFHPED